MHLTFKPLHGIGSETLSMKLVYKHGSYITAQAEYVDINTREENTISLNALKCYTYNHKGYRKTSIADNDVTDYYSVKMLVPLLSPDLV